MLSGKKILVGVTGGIAAYKTPFLVRQLVEKKASVRVVITEAAHHFVTPLVLETLSGSPVSSELFPRQFASTHHIELARWPDLIVVAPATADFIGRVASGLAPDLLCNILLATRSEVLLAPAMNTEMWHHMQAQENCAKLEKLQYHFIGPEEGKLATALEGEGMGRMSEPETIVKRIEEIFSDRKLLKGKKIIVTGGRTEEAIDPVRYLSNRSSGKMGAALAKAAARMGAKVTFVHGRMSVEPPRNTENLLAPTAFEMQRRLSELYPKSDAVIMAAAVSDFRPEKVSKVKIKRQGKLTLELIPNPDILDGLGKAKKKQKLVGFALEEENGLENGKKKLIEKNLDMLVFNRADQPDAGFEVDTNRVTLYFPSGKKEEVPLASKEEVARVILKKLAGIL
ncbi:MAG TPA: bifunctional phosphopantothenoylcysteine decarboxylase/phosphopantothenate--cysteine ligase CoaBC [candidate division Zixibacteria bacterium]|nr:bifunctional phosphopantothenoylcysteine decarboxylase/phosphopantothenate--cysteine ligase CoaBC [candidate division Zixibacteria bacterium]